MNPSPNPSMSLPSSYSSQIANDYSSTAAATAAAALSQQHTPTPNATGANGRKRRASGVPGSRGVANLTPDQLSKKRANDREAQRAIRERTRNTITSLEQRIRELESQQPFQELQKVAQERDRALAECEELKRKLAAVANVVGGSGQQQQQQPNLHGMFDALEPFVDPSWLTESDAELAALTAQQSPLPPLNAHPQSGTGQAYEQGHIHPDLRSPSAATHPSPVSHTATAGPTYQTETTSLRRWSPSLGHPPNAQYAPTNGISYDQRLPPPAAMQAQNNDKRLDLNYMLEPKPHSASTSPISHHSPAYVPQPTAPEKPIHARLPNNSTPSCPLDSLLLDFLTNRQKQLASGVPIREVAGPEYPFLMALKDPSSLHSSKCHPVSALLIDILSKFPDIYALPEKVAVLYIMFLILRWEICPCESCYHRLPEWMRPQKEQLEIPHPAWHEHVPWCVPSPSQLINPPN